MCERERERERERELAGLNHSHTHRARQSTLERAPPTELLRQLSWLG